MSFLRSRGAGSRSVLAGLLLATLTTLTVACGGSSPSTYVTPDTVTIDTPSASPAGRVQVRIGDLIIDAETARTVDERAQGLSDRDQMAVGEGMLFFMESERIPGFHMRGMRFPLDFIWISSDLRVADLTENVPHPASPDDESARIQPRSPVLYVLEVNAGVIEASGVRIGDEVVFDPDEANQFTNGGFEQGGDPWISLTTAAWGTPFSVSERQALEGSSSALLELRSVQGGSTRVFGVVQEISPEEFPQTISGYYFVEDWQKGTDRQYLQFVVIVFEADNMPAEFAEAVSNYQVRYILAGVDSQPTFISNARYVMVTGTEPAIGEWVYFERNVAQDFLDLWGEVPEGFDKLRVLFEVRWDDRADTDGLSSADVYYDDLYFGPQR